MQELPEAVRVRRECEARGAEPAVVLAVLLKTLGDDHLAEVAKLDEEQTEERYWEGTAMTLLEKVLEVMLAQGERNGDCFMKALRPGMSEKEAEGYPKFAGELSLLQDDVRDMVAVYIDHLDRLDRMGTRGVEV